MEPYEELQQQLPEEMTLEDICKLMKVSYSVTWMRMKALHTPSHVAPWDNRIKLVNKADVIELLRYYRVLG